MRRRKLLYVAIGIAAGVGLLIILNLQDKWKESEGTVGIAAETESYGIGSEKISVTGKREKETEKSTEEEEGKTEQRQSEVQEGNSSYGQEIKDEFDNALREYQETVHPEISEDQDYAKDVFIGDRQEKFDKAIADYIFYLYGDIKIDRVELVEFVEESDGELTYQIRVHSGAESEPFLCTYNKEYGFYSLYTYNDVRG